MGCTHSQLEHEEDVSYGLRPSSSPGIRRRMNRKARASATKTLNGAGSEVGSGKQSPEPARRSTPPHSVPSRPPQMHEADGKRKKEGLGPALGGERTSGKGDFREDIPGSPSFRFYFEGTWEDKEFAGKASQKRGSLATPRGS